jgi:HK97 family phage major capsid protein/HK97 family phage prohead protease
MTTKQRPTQLAPQRRTLSMRLAATGDDQTAALNAETRTVDLVFASETPVDMWFGTEILSMAPGAMRTGVRQETLPLLFNHDMDDLLGVVQSIAIGADKVARATVRFGKDERGEWAMQQVADGVLVNVSFAYRVFKWEDDVENDTLTALDWEPYEISLVTVPADPTVGVGRSADACTNDVVITKRSTAAPAAAPASPTQSTQPGDGAASRSTTKEDPAMRFRTQPHRLQEQAESTTSASGGGGTTTTAAPAGQTDAQARLQGAEAERARMTEIHAICKRYDIPADVRDGMIQRGATIEQARLTAADLVMERSKAKPAADFGGDSNPDMTEKEKARYSMIRAVNAAISGNWKDAGFELECSNEVMKRAARQQSHERSFFIPTNIPFARAAYTVGTPGSGTTGGTMVATNLLAGSFIEVLRNQSRVMQLGARMLSGLVGSVDIPRQTGQSSAFWTAEGVNTTESEATFDKVSLAMKTIGTYSQITRNMLMQSTPDIDMIARADLIAVLALGIDLAALSGAGSGGVPLGIANTAGIGSVVGGTNGAQVTLDHYIDLETQLTSSNAPEDSLAYLGNAKTVGWTKKLKSTTGQYLWTNNPNGQRSGTPGEINGYTFARSNQARSNLTKGTASGICSELFFGAWSELLIGEWGVLEIVPNPYDASAFKNGGVLLRALQSVDVAVRHAASFAVMSDALTA